MSGPLHQTLTSTVVLLDRKLLSEIGQQLTMIRVMSSIESVYGKGPLVSPIRRLAGTGDQCCNVGRRRIWTRIKSTHQRVPTPTFSTLPRAWPGGLHALLDGRNLHGAWNPQAPAGTMAWAVDVPRGESQQGSHLCRTRDSGRSIPGPGASLIVQRPGYVGQHTTPSSGAPRVCHPNGHTTA